MTDKEFATMIADEEKRLGVGSREFLERHNEIMEEIELLKNMQLSSCNGLHVSMKGDREV